MLLVVIRVYTICKGTAYRLYVRLRKAVCIELLFIGHSGVYVGCVGL